MIGIPLYMHLANQIKEKINRRALKPGDMLPSEHELADEYKASRTTVRKGLSILFSEGFINPVPGKGYFVKEPEIDSYILNFNERGCIENYSDETRLLEVKLVPPGKLSQQLGDSNKSFVMIRWLIYSGKKPVAYDVKYLPYDRGKPIVEREIHYATIPEMVAKHQSLFSIKKTLRISAPKATPELKKLLDLESDESVILVEQKLFNAQDKPIGFGQLYMKGEYCNLMAVSSYRQTE
ncbi:MAG: GntR family transcriptional regulator [Thermacetogeniaceae bacterium]